MQNSSHPKIALHRGLANRYGKKDRNREDRNGNWSGNVPLELWSIGPACVEVFEKVHEDDERRPQTEFQQINKEKVLCFVLSKCIDPHRSTERLFIELRDILPQVKEAYDVSLQEKFDDERFLKMCAEDGCLTVLLAYDILGANLGISYQDPIFGSGCVREDMVRWQSSLLFVGNQLLYVVLEKVMNTLDYFQSLRTQLKDIMTKPPLEVFRRALYELVVTDFQEPPVDVIDCLRSVVLGEEPQASQCNMWIFSEDLRNTGASASELPKQGYDFKPLDINMGSRQIKVSGRCRLRNDIIHLPVLEVDEDTEQTFKYLRAYEEVHRGIKDPEITHYLILLSSLIQTESDVEFLRKRGIIRGPNFERLHSIFGSYYNIKLPPPSPIRNGSRRELPLPQKLKYLNVKWMATAVFFVSLLKFIFSYLQTHYTVAGYYKRH